MSVWKEFLVRKSFVDHSDCLGNPIHKEAVYLKDLEEFALRKCKEIKNRIKECGLQGKISECDYLEGRLGLAKELAGVEQ